MTANAGRVTSVVFGPSIHDSVDADDGALDGSGLAGDDYFSGNGSAGVTFSFSAGVLGALPTHAGLVWTDGDGSTTFEAFDHNGVSLGVVTVGLANGSFNGETNEDRFFGAIDPLGISAIKISNSSGGIEIDHVQYGLATAVSEPETYALMLAGLGMLGALARRRGRAR
ncbi:MAG: PEP-CTERM sorting domain-containing protein [Caldimonas sp.]